MYCTTNCATFAIMERKMGLEPTTHTLKGVCCKSLKAERRDSNSQQRAP